MIRVAFSIGNYDSLTGAQQSLLYLVENVSLVDPTIVTPEYGAVNAAAAERGVEAEVLRYPAALDQFGGELLQGDALDFARRGFHYARYQTTVLRYLRRSEFDVLYCNDLRSLYLFAPAARLLSMPVVWYIRNDPKGGYSGTPMLDRVGARLATHIVCISEGVYRRFEDSAVSDAKFTTIHTGVDVDEFDPDRAFETTGSVPEADVTIVQVASLHPRKGQDVLIEAIARADDELGDYVLLLVGGASAGQSAYEEKLRRMVDDRGLSDRVHFLGWRDDVPALLARSDVFVLPSYHEGLPRSVLEALSMGLPVIATPAGGTEAIVRDGETGSIVPMDAPDELADEIVRYATDAQLRTEHGERGRRLMIEEFSVESYADEFDRYIQCVANGG